MKNVNSFKTILYISFLTPKTMFVKNLFPNKYKVARNIDFVKPCANIILIFSPVFVTIIIEKILMIRKIKW